MATLLSLITLPPGNQLCESPLSTVWAVSMVTMRGVVAPGTPKGSNRRGTGHHAGAGVGRAAADAQAVGVGREVRAGPVGVAVREPEVVRPGLVIVGQQDAVGPGLGRQPDGRLLAGGVGRVLVDGVGVRVHAWQQDDGVADAAGRVATSWFRPSGSRCCGPWVSGTFCHAVGAAMAGSAISESEGLPHEPGLKAMPQP